MLHGLYLHTVKTKILIVKRRAEVKKISPIILPISETKFDVGETEGSGGVSHCRILPRHATSATLQSSGPLTPSHGAR
jgi:hypothetical protein